jgi:hypothetical protein
MGAHWVHPTGNSGRMLIPGDRSRNHIANKAWYDWHGHNKDAAALILRLKQVSLSLTR